MEFTIYIRLLNEDIEVWRPVLARKINESIYEILNVPINEIPKNETWEFIPGSLVGVKEKQSDGDKILVAISLVQ